MLTNLTKEIKSLYTKTFKILMKEIKDTKIKVYMIWEN